MQKLDYPVVDVSDIRAARLTEELTGLDATASVYLNDLTYSVVVQDATDSAAVDIIVAAHNPLIKSQLELDGEFVRTAETDASTIKTPFLQLRSAAKANYAALSGAQKTAALNIFTDDVTWGTATTDQKLDTFRAIISLLIIAVAFIYIRTFSNNG